MKYLKQIKAIMKVVYLLLVFVMLLTSSLVWSIFDPSVFYWGKKGEKVWRPKDIAIDLPEGRKGRLIKYGHLLISETSNYMGPQAKNPEVRYAGNNLSCQNCHLEAGTKPGSASFVGVVNRFPQFRGREGKIGTLEERVNGCMERSMNGRAMPVNSTQMKAIIIYMEWLSEGVPPDKKEIYKGFVKVEVPAFKADLVEGETIYTAECQLCHGVDGQGQRPVPDKPYLYPPLWGEDSYNHGAGMHRVLTAAQFIKGNMPHLQASWDQPKLTDEQAFHVAAYINSFDRPLKNNPGADFPDIKLKPVSTPYGPWADGFPTSQHKYGPFLPIIDFYQKEYNLRKTK